MIILRYFQRYSSSECSKFLSFRPHSFFNHKFILTLFSCSIRNDHTYLVDKMINYLVYIHDLVISVVPLGRGTQRQAEFRATEYCLRKMRTRNKCAAELCLNFDLPLEAVKYAVREIYGREITWSPPLKRMPKHLKIKRGAKYEGMDGTLTYHGNGEFTSHYSWSFAPPVRESIMVAAPPGILMAQEAR